MNEWFAMNTFEVCVDNDNIKTSDCIINDEKLFVLPKDNKPLKVIYEELPCPILLQLGEDYRCKHAQSKLEGMEYTLYCANEDCEVKIAYRKDMKA